MSSVKYTRYKTPFPVGVKLPEIKIEKIFMLTRDQIPDMVDNAMQLRIVYTVPLMRELAFLDIDVATMDV